MTVDRNLDCLYRPVRDERAFIEDRLGAPFYERLDKAVFVLKAFIRNEELSNSKGTKAEKSKLTKEILSSIETFYSGLALHSELSPPKIDTAKH